MPTPVPTASPETPVGRGTAWLRAFVVAAACVPLGLAFRPDAVVADKPLVEDAFYGLSVARNVALGNGISADGILPTNGFQPLHTFLLVPLYLLTGGDRLAAIPWVFVLEWVFHLFAIAGVMRLARTMTAGAGDSRANMAAAVAGALWCASPHVWRMSFCGLETGMLLAAAAWFLVLVERALRDPAFPALRIGLAAGALGLVRVDTVFLSAAAAGALMLDRRRAHRWRDGVVVGLVTAVVTAPWWGWGLAEFGSLLPAGGHATAGSIDAVPRGPALLADAVASGLAPNLWWWDESGVSVVVRVAGAIVVLVAAARIARAGPEHVRGLIVVQIAAALGLVVWYATRSRAFFFYLRYMVPLALLGVPVAAAVLADSFGRTGRRSVVTAIGAGTAVLVAAVAWTAGSSIPGIRAGNQFLAQQVPLVARGVPPGERVASFQTGTLGYFRDGVVNLDGKSNPGALTHPGGPAGLLRDEDVRWLCDTYTLAAPVVATPEGRREWRLVSRLGMFRLWQRAE